MYSPRVKRLAYQLDPLCWESYSSCAVEHKRAMEARRIASLNLAAIAEAPEGYCTLKEFEDMMAVVPEWAPGMPITAEPDCVWPRLTQVLQLAKELKGSTTMPPMKIAMMLHFASVCDGYHNRHNAAYRKFCDELLNERMIRSTIATERGSDHDWAYTATDKGRVYVDALTQVPQPVRTETPWVMPGA